MQTVRVFGVSSLLLGGLFAVACGEESHDGVEMSGGTGGLATGGSGKGGAPSGSGGATAESGGQRTAGEAGAGAQSGEGGEAPSGGGAGVPGGGEGGGPQGGMDGRGGGPVDGGGVGGAQAGGGGEAGFGGGGAGGAENPCTGPGSTNPKSISGFPPGPTATLTTGAWSGWGTSHGTSLNEDVVEADSALHTTAPGDSRTSYFLAPANMLGDLSNVAGVSFALKTKSVGGSYYESGYAYLGDVVVRGAGGTTTAFAMVSHKPDSEWHRYFIPFDSGDTCWSADSGTLTDIWGDVTGLAIRAEFSTGDDNTWLADFSFVMR